ncbi:hypothetical protein [Azospirillum thiophilum]|nr:hypothetical protein [Azospirillum thiophilum]
MMDIRPSPPLVYHACDHEKPPVMENAMNRDWHEAHPIPPKATRRQRVEWHLAHSQACGCRPPPPSLLPEIRDLERQRLLAVEGGAIR